MLSGPVGSPYPGKYLSFEMAAICALVAWKALKSAVQIIKEKRKNAAQGITYKPDPKKDFGKVVVAAFMATFMLGFVLFSIYKYWPA